METRLIHHAQTTTEYKFVTDPDLGVVRKGVQTFKRSTIDRIVFGATGATYEVGPDNTFEVPVDVAAFFLRQPDWHPGPSPFPGIPVEEKPAAVTSRKPRAKATAE